VIPTALADTVVHVLGPSRDPEMVKRMKPPKAVRWLQFAEDERPAEADSTPLFEPRYAVAPDRVAHVITEEARTTIDRLALRATNLSDELPAAASVLESSVNNTSLFFVLSIRETRLVFVGDSQYGAWEHVLNAPGSRELVTQPAFYKIGHHGSHNATPKRYAEEILGVDAYAMMPFGPVSQWPSIPEHKLLDALALKGTHLVRADDPTGDGVKVGPKKRWSEIEFLVP